MRIVVRKALRGALGMAWQRQKRLRRSCQSVTPASVLPIHSRSSEPCSCPSPNLALVLAPFPHIHGHPDPAPPLPHTCAHPHCAPPLPPPLRSSSSHCPTIVVILTLHLSSRTLALVPAPFPRTRGHPNPAHPLLLTCACPPPLSHTYAHPHALCRVNLQLRQPALNLGNL